MPKSKIITIEIIKSTRDGYWYNNKIGEIFDVRVFNGNYNRYQVVNQINSLIRTVDKNDTRIIDRFDKIKKIKDKIDKR